MTADELRIGSSQEPPLQASKWLQLQLLIDEVEMSGLLDALGDFRIFMAGVVCADSEGELSKDAFLQLYESYASALKAGQLPDETRYRAAFSSVFTVDSNDLFQLKVTGNRRIIRVIRPVLQLQMNKMAYSALDGKFRPMVLGKDSIFWGIQFSYPQLYQNKRNEVFKTLDAALFPNSELYRRLQAWVRRATVPTPFQTGEITVNSPMRIGKNCLPWINQHPQLIQQNIQVVHSTQKS